MTDWPSASPVLVADLLASKPAVIVVGSRALDLAAKSYPDDPLDLVRER